MPGQLDITVAEPVVSGMSPIVMNFRLSPLASVTAMTLPPDVTLLPISSIQLAMKGVPSDLVRVIVAEPLPAAMALLTKIVVCQVGPSAICGK